MPSVQQNTQHPVLTRRRQLQYVFTPKHHGEPGQSCWLTELTFDEEFAIFDNADFFVLADTDGNLYGYERRGNSLRKIGTQYQQIAKFPVPTPGNPWHGYPLYPLSDARSPNRSGQSGRPPKAIFTRMVELGHISTIQAKQLKKGNLI